MPPTVAAHNLRLVLLPLPGTRKKPYAVDEKGGRQEDIGNERTNTDTHIERKRARDADKGKRDSNVPVRVFGVRVVVASSRGKCKIMAQTSYILHRIRVHINVCTTHTHTHTEKENPSRSCSRGLTQVPTPERVRHCDI